jgi:hypothetical protein
MKQGNHHSFPTFDNPALRLAAAAPEERKSLITRFGESVDVRNRGTLRMSRFAGSQTQSQAAPAVVRLWIAEQCHEFSAHQARGMAAQLLAAAALADSQNNH